MSDMVDKNTFLILIKLDLTDTNPLGKPWSGAQGLPRMEADKNYALIAGLLDPSQQTTRTPLTPVSFNSIERKENYNKILARFEHLIELFYESPSGFIFDPGRLDSAQQEAVTDEIRGIGRDIFDLIPRKTPLCNWFDELFEAAEPGRQVSRRAEERHVTIITNDFNIPWYWMRGTASSPLLCEVCSLGMLQLANRNAVELDADLYQLPEAAKDKPLHALLINGSGESDLPFMEEELSSLSGFLRQGKERPRRRLRSFEGKIAAKIGEVRALWLDHSKIERRALYRLVHIGSCTIPGTGALKTKNYLLEKSRLILMK
jgi:hypothetical protein